MTNDPIQVLLDRSKELQEEVPKLLGGLDDQIVDAAIIEREEFKGEIQGTLDSLENQIGEIKTVQRKLRGVKTDQTINIKQLTSRAFQIRRERKPYHA